MNDSKPAAAEVSVPKPGLPLVYGTVIDGGTPFDNAVLDGGKP